MLAKNLTAVMEFDGDVEEQFMCTFALSYSDVMGVTCTHDLKENGKDIPVTNENRKVNMILNIIAYVRQETRILPIYGSVLCAGNLCIASLGDGDGEGDM